VYKARRKYTGQIVAMKFIAKHGKTDKDIKSLRQEIEILRGLRHDNIIAMVDSFETKAGVLRRHRVCTRRAVRDLRGRQVPAGG
jgi:serine/threonine protein kinase